MALNLKRVAYDQIRADLQSGKLTAGSILSAAGMAKQLGISHTPVREAISQLETEGFVEQVPRLGHQIIAVSRAELDELFELREFLEVGAVAKAARRISPEAIEQLWEFCDHYLRLAKLWRDTDDVAKRDDVLANMARVDAAFHIQLLMASGNRRLIKLVGDLHLMAFLFRRHAQIPRAAALARWARAHREHCRIVRALARRDGLLAATTMQRHLEDAKAFYLGMYDCERREIPADGDTDRAWSSELLKSLGQESTVGTQRRTRRAKRTRTPACESAGG
jgi:DNA-binding GntR family transcriptional regulator